MQAGLVGQLQLMQQTSISCILLHGSPVSQHLQGVCKRIYWQGSLGGAENEGTAVVLLTVMSGMSSL